MFDLVDFHSSEYSFSGTAKKLDSLVSDNFTSFTSMHSALFKQGSIGSVTLSVVLVVANVFVLVSSGAKFLNITLQMHLGICLAITHTSAKSSTAQALNSILVRTFGQIHAWIYQTTIVTDTNGTQAERKIEQLEGFLEHETIFIGGSMSSGTSLVRSLLDVNPSVKCGPETKFIQLILDFMKKMYKNDKTSLWFMKAAGIKNNTLDKSVGLAIYYVMLSNIRWNEDNRDSYNQCLRTGPHFCMVLRYDSLVKNPEKETRKMTDFLGVKWSKRMLKHQKYIGSKWIGNVPGYQKNLIKDTIDMLTLQNN
ncbi:hypothetical protein BpHYR1_034913 [Brachionus plicatilis]|uniref:Protein-tyrosine sulfotransferase n=1 Tax=Brachionus plicatilis TaxID=10195 RepID=A0A3M7RXL7_BRAPC|nr:hypothetical protein BpHYR1_034913 [Brachionus plicatilis]